MSEAEDVTKFLSIIADGKHYLRYAAREELFDADSDPLDTLNLVETPAGQAALPAFRATVDSIKRAGSTRRSAPTRVQ